MIKNLYPLFSEPLYETKIDLSSDELEKVLDVYEQEEFTSINQSVLNKLMITENRKVIDKLPFLHEKLSNAFHDYTREFLNYSNKFKMVNSWFTKTLKGGYSNWHYHANYAFSSVFYFGNDEQVSQISFKSYKQKTFNLQPKKYNMYNNNEFNIKVKNGMLLIFPSHLWHKVDDQSCDEIRKSLASNWFPIGDIGERDGELFIQESGVQ
tara:strand:+ start:1091 stop:1717 length:627 start_codon:yes stop_codon:yes gene_type:complete